MHLFLRFIRPFSEVNLDHADFSHAYVSFSFKLFEFFGPTFIKILPFLE